MPVLHNLDPYRQLDCLVAEPALRQTIASPVGPDRP